MIYEDEMITILCRDLELDLNLYTFQFLWFIPIIEVMWADRRCEKQEVDILFHYVDSFVRQVNTDIPHINTECARRFFMPLLKPAAINDPRKREGLSRLVDKIIQDVVEPAHPEKRSRLFHICTEVAMAAQSGITGRSGSWISAEEAHLLQDLLYELRLEGAAYGHQAFIPDTRYKPQVRLNGGFC